MLVPIISDPLISVPVMVDPSTSPPERLPPMIIEGVDAEPEVLGWAPTVEGRETLFDEGEDKAFDEDE